MLKISYLGHASFKIEDENKSVVFDPYQDGMVPNLIFPKNVEADFVFCSHNHADHNARDKVRLLANGQQLEYSEILVPHDKEKGAKRGMNFVRIVYLGDYKIVHLGDIGDISDYRLLASIKNADIVFCPINGFFTISAEEARQLYDTYNIQVMIPMHYEYKELGVGYPDGGQIEKFEKLFPNNKKVNEGSIEFTRDDYDYNAIIFNKFIQ